MVFKLVFHTDNVIKFVGSNLQAEIVLRNFRCIEGKVTNGGVKSIGTNDDIKLFMFSVGKFNLYNAGIFLVDFLSADTESIFRLILMRARKVRFLIRHA